MTSQQKDHTHATLEHTLSTLTLPCPWAPCPCYPQAAVGLCNCSHAGPRVQALACTCSFPSLLAPPLPGLKPEFWQA
jgi:hypothetical protein